MSHPTNTAQTTLFYASVYGAAAFPRAVNVATAVTETPLVSSKLQLMLAGRLSVETSTNITSGKLPVNSLAPGLHFQVDEQNTPNRTEQIWIYGQKKEPSKREPRHELSL